MAGSRKGEKRQPVKYRWIPDLESGPTRYNEPDLQRTEDRMPKSTFEPSSSKADLRLRVEQLLLRKEFSRELWAELGTQARDLLVELLNDESVESRPAILHRAIAALGQLQVKRGIAPLSAMLHRRSTDSLTKAYAANALGRIGEPAGVEALAGALDDSDVMVRRQIAMALGRIEGDLAVPYLLKLRDDKSVPVAEVAAQAMQRHADKRGSQQPKGKAKAQQTSKKKVVPMVERSANFKS